ncbi:unnamed protein product [Ilex paraguariensis]|uniref:Uncharacterized protein n=1 Tax=Ilex paraguariensis TaxID=185542 RepID=A0ABC8S619_9AQUA
MARKFTQIVSVLMFFIEVLNFPAFTTSDTTLPDQTLYASPPPPYGCPYCMPPPSAPTNCPPPPSPPLPTVSPPPPPGSVYYPPPPGYYSPPYFPYNPTPGYVYPAPPPPDPILPYFPFYYLQPPPPPGFSSADGINLSVKWIACMLLLNYMHPILRPILHFLTIDEEG